MKMVSVVIPVYKSSPSEDERRSLLQCIKILGRYDILLVCPEGVDMTEYHQIAGDAVLTEKRFPAEYFRSIDGYNALMTSEFFYRTFESWRYILIYQLDAWVFSDQLEAWCAKGYDYVGAPWFEDWGFRSEGKKLWRVGNGGLSLRRVRKFVTLTSPRTILRGPREIFAKEYKGPKDFFTCLKRIFGGKGNNMQGYRKEMETYYEDVYFCLHIHPERLSLKMPDVREAAEFSIEKSPAYLFEHIGARLPFGCHAWRKYDYDSFWSHYII